MSTPTDPKWYTRKSWFEAEVNLSEFDGGLGTVVVQDARREFVNEYEKVHREVGAIDDQVASLLLRAYVHKGYDGMPGKGSSTKVWLEWFQKMHNKPMQRLIAGITRFRSEQEPEATLAGNS